MSTSNRIELCDLKAQHQELMEPLTRKIREVIDSSAFINGKYLDEFEKRFTSLHRAAHGIGCSNGTSAIRLVLEAMGIGPGDEVITPSHTFFATAEAVITRGAKPVFVDIQPDTYTIDVTQIEAAVTPKTRAILPVHIYGNPCEMDAIWDIARRHRLFVIEDSAQAHFAEYRGQYIGTRSDAATFSFFPGKNLGAMGDAGFIFCADAELARKTRMLVNHGRDQEKYLHHAVGYNERLDALQAAILTVKLDHILEWTEKRRQVAAFYDGRFRAKGFKTMKPLPEGKAVYHEYVLEVGNRNETMKALAAEGIASGIHYPVPLHRQPALASMGYGEQCLPVTEKVAEKVLSLPIYPEMTAEQMERVASTFLKVARPA